MCISYFSARILVWKVVLSLTSEIKVTLQIKIMYCDDGDELIVYYLLIFFPLSHQQQVNK